MGKISVETCDIEGLKVITPTVFGDARGYFVETYNKNDFVEAGIDVEFVQDINGEVFDVAVDLRRNSATFGKWFGVVLSAENKKQFFIPKGFAHGFYVLSEYAEFAYKFSDFYHPNDEGGLKWNDPDIGVEWPLIDGVELNLSDKDTKWGGIKEF